MADTCGTLVKAAAVLKENGAKSVLALVTHGILSGNAIETLNGSVLSALVVTNTVPLGDKVQRVCQPQSLCSKWFETLPNLIQCPKLRVIDISPTIAEAIRRTHNGKNRPGPSHDLCLLILTRMQASRFRTCSTTPLFKSHNWQRQRRPATHGTTRRNIWGPWYM
jgi:hypothetical protein